MDEERGEEDYHKLPYGQLCLLSKKKGGVVSRQWDWRRKKFLFEEGERIHQENIMIIVQNWVSVWDLGVKCGVRLVSTIVWFSPTAFGCSGVGMGIWTVNKPELELASWVQNREKWAKEMSVATEVIM